MSYLTPDDAAKRLGVHVQTIRRLVRDKRIPTIPYHGRIILIDPVAFAEFAVTYKPGRGRKDWGD